MAPVTPWFSHAVAVAGLHPECGDGYLVQERSATELLIAVMDGEGHGVEAAAATDLGLQTLAEHREERDLAMLLQLCHNALRPARGGALALVLATPTAVTWISVGNVEALLANPDGKTAHLVSRPGIVGVVLPPVVTTGRQVGPGTRLVIATDGVRAGFSEGAFWRGTPERVASRMLSTFGKGTDDALVLVGDWGTP